MKIFFGIFAVFLCFISISTEVLAEAWEDETGGITDSEFITIAVDHGSSKDVYIGTNIALYRIKDTKGAWEELFLTKGEFKGVNHIYPSGSQIYIATGNGAYRSDDSGINWERIYNGLRQQQNRITRILPGNSGIYLGTLKGLFWSKNGTHAWQKPDGILGRARITSFAPTATDENIFVIADNEVYKIDGKLSNYTKVFGNDKISFVDEDDLDLKSFDEEGPNRILTDIKVSNGRIYLSTNKGLFVSTDDGNSWERFNSAGLLDRRIAYTLPVENNSKIFTATKNGIFVYNRLEEEWKGLYVGMAKLVAKWLALERATGTLWAVCENRVYKIKLSDNISYQKEQGEADIILSRFEGEPAINEVMNMAIDYAEVYPEKIEKWRRGARFKALLPKVNIGIDHGWSDTYEIYTSSSTSYWLDGPRDNTEGWDLNLTWNLGDLIWNPSQTSIDVRSKLMVQLRDDIVDEVNRAYFERRRLQVELYTNPPDDVRALIKKRLRIQELTASLDGLTGGHFSQAIQE